MSGSPPRVMDEGSATRRLGWGRIVLGGLLSHVCTVAIVAMAALTGALLAADGPVTQAFQAAAPRWGLRLGPIAGALLACYFGAWAARRNPGREVTAGTLLGVVAALTLSPLLAAATGATRLVYAASMLLKVLGGAAGGWATRRRAAHPGMLAGVLLHGVLAGSLAP